MTPDQKAKRMETQKAYRSRKKPIEIAISEFHDIASEGPVYICFVAVSYGTSRVF